MNELLTERAFAKINLMLRVIGRRADGYHELESLVAFADIGDTLTFWPGEAISLDITGSYADLCGPKADNLILKAFAALRERVSGLAGGRFVLEKTLPIAAGIGGGSADAAAALRLLTRANAIANNDARLFSAARAVGADVPVCLEARARIMRGAGELLSAPIEMPSLPALLVNPGVPIATREVFSRWAQHKKASKDLGSIPQDFDGFISFLNEHDNDLTPAAIACANIIDDVLSTLRALPNVLLARMSGSGSTCFALFSSMNAAVSAACELKVKHKDWWICATKLGSQRSIGNGEK